MREKGYLDAGAMADTFDALRANDLIWNYVASGWLMGEARRRSTSSRGTPTRPACPPACTPSTCADATSRTGSRRGTSRCGGTAVALDAVDGRHLLRLGAGGPHHAVERLLPHDARCRRRRPLRPHLVGPHRRDRQPARREAQPLHRRSSAPIPRVARARDRCRAHGGRTGRAGSASAPASAASRRRSGATPIRRSRTRPGPTFSAERSLD